VKGLVFRAVSNLAYIAPMLLVAAHRMPHQAAATQSGRDYGWVYFWVWVGGWLASITIARKRGIQTGLFIWGGWILGPIAVIIAAIIKPSPPVVPVAPESDPNIAKWLDAVETGNLPIIRPAGIMPVDGESFVYEQRGQYGQTYSQRITRGGSPALYVPLGRGFRARVGGYQGRSQNVTNFAWGPMGTVFVSNLRIIFKTDGRPDVAVAPYNKIVAYETYPNGLGLQVDGVGMMQFRTGDVILGLLFKKIVEQRFAAASTAQASCVGGSPLG